MESEVKQRNQRNRRRERAQRMQAQRESKVKDGDSGEDESPAREKPPRPPARRKKSKEPLGEEDIIDGFAIMAFRTYEDLEAAVKVASAPRTTALSAKPRLPADPSRNHPTHSVTSHTLTSTLLHDPGTSDDSGRASERLTGSSVAPRDPDSSRDRLSDASSRCSSGKGYICDSEDEDEKASPENSRNASPRYHDASMQDVSDAASLFRVTGASAVSGKSELVARGGSGGALALSRAPVGGSASPAPAPLPQPAPSPAPAALPPPALPPPPFRADTPHTPHRPNGAVIPALDGQAATQIPARPVGAAGPDTPERPASNNKLQPGARAAADSPTPAPPAPPAPSPLFPSHTAYQSHAAAALPDYRHTNHETRTDQPEQPSAPLDLHSARPPHLAPSAAQPSLPSLPNRVVHSQPHPGMPGHEIRNIPTAPTHPSVPTSLSRMNGIPPGTPSLAAPTSHSSCLPSQALSGRTASPTAPTSRPFPTPSIGSSHVHSSINSSIHNHSMPYQSQSSLQKHSVPPVYASRPSHLAPFSAPNHVQSFANQPTATHLSHPINSHSIMNHMNHLPLTNSHPLATSTPNHIGLQPSVASTAASTIPGFTPSVKHPGLSLPPHSAPIVPPVSLHSNHMDVSMTSAPAIVTSSSNLPNSHPLAPPKVDSRQPPVVDSRQAPDSRSLSLADSRLSGLGLESRPSIADSKQPPVIDSRPPVIDSRPPVSMEGPPRSDSLAVSTIATNGYPPPAVYSGAAYPPLYAPYATTLQHSPYLPPAAASPRNTADTRTSLSSSPLVAPKTPKGVRPHTPGTTAHSYSPRGPSPSRERESFSNISSLSRSTPASASSAAGPAPLAVPLAAPLALEDVRRPHLGINSHSIRNHKTPLVGPMGSAPGGAGLAAPTPTAAAPTPLAHSLAPVPTVPSISSSAKPPAHWGVTRAPSERAGFAPAPLFGAPLAPPNPNPNPFSAESLFQTSPGADLLRRELDNRFLAAAGAAGAAARTELHHHQHQHTHVHQHPHHHPLPHHPGHPGHPAAPPHHAPPQSTLFKDVSKMSSLYRSGMGLGLGYPYSSMLHPAAPFAPPAPPAPLTSYAPKPVVSASDAAKPPPRPAVKTGKWNAMHVRIAWEIYNHQQKEKGGAGGGGGGLVPDKDKLRAFPPPAPPPPFRSPYDLPPAPYLHHPHLGVSPFARYGAGAFPGAPTFGLSAYGRDLALSSSLHGVHHGPPLGLHDAWRVRPPAPGAAVAAAEARRDHEERERARRDREERERREREDRERRKQREREMERARTRSPLRNGVPEQQKEERKEGVRTSAPGLGGYPPPPVPAMGGPWDPYRAFDPLQHMRFAPLVEAAIRAEEDRAKMFSAYAHHQQLKAAPLLHRGMPLPPHGPMAPHGPHGPHGPLPPLAPPLAPHAPPLASLDLLKKEEPR